MAATESPEATAFHLAGNFAPVPDEISATDLEVTGEIPETLHGMFVRNGPNPPDGGSPHLFMGTAWCTVSESRTGALLGTAIDG